MELSRLEEFYKTQSRFYDITRPLFLFNRKKALSFLDFGEDDKVLDLACGTGLNISYLSRRVPQKNITGIDYSDSMLKKAKSKFPKVRFIHGDVSDCALGGRFDKIVCTYSLSMIDRWEEAIRNARRHLYQNGTFLVLDFNSWHSALNPIYSVFRSWLKMHGVDSGRDYVPELMKNFESVKRRDCTFGYNQIIAAEQPKNLLTENGGIN